MGLKKNIVSSRSEFKRLIEGRAIVDTRTGEKIFDISFRVIQPLNIKIGKRRFLNIRITK